jgi:hypothetical protein
MATKGRVDPFIKRVARDCYLRVKQPPADLVAAGAVDVALADYTLALHEAVNAFMQAAPPPSAAASRT